MPRGNFQGQVGGVLRQSVVRNRFGSIASSTSSIPPVVLRQSRRSLRKSRRYLGKGNINRTHGSLVPSFVKSLPFPRKMFKTLKYSQNFHLTGAALGLFGAVEKMRLNSLFDPDQTGTGHQPYGRDTMASIYQRYKVFDVNIVLKVISPSETSCVLGCLITGPSNSGDTIQGLTIDQVREKNMCSIHYCTSNEVKSLTKKMHIRLCDVMGITPAQYKNDLDNTTAGSGGNPSDECAIQFACVDFKGANDTNADIWIAVDIYYRTQFYELVELAQS